jgi:competence CoiA-like predicted nuclease
VSAVKEGQHKYCETVYSRSGINHMWILKNSKDLLDNLKSRSFSQVSSIKTFDFSTLYTTLPHDKLKTRLKETIGDKYVIDEELQHTDHLFLGVACFTFLNFV